MSQGFVYILTNKNNGVLYTGATSDLATRIYQHKKRVVKGFTWRYNNVDKLVYYELLEDILSAYERERQIKAGSRKKKEELINKLNPSWRDLYKEL